MKAQNITIIGLNRIGASVALALRQSSLDVTLTGYDSDQSVAREAKQAGVIDRTDWHLVSAAAAADVLVLTTPTHELEKTLETIGRDVPPHALVLDLAGLKGLGLRWAGQYLKQGHYVGAAPVLAAAQLADGRYGLEAARADLFQNSVFCLMPSAEADPKAVETAVVFGRLLGAKPFFVDPHEYDNLVQGVETLPGLLAAAMFRAVTQSTGWRDMVRFAGLPFAMATLALREEADIPFMALKDRAATLHWLDALTGELSEIRRWVAEEDHERLAALAEQLNEDRERWLLERERNEWEDKELPGMEEVGAVGMNLFGRLGQFGRRDKDQDD